MATFYLLAILSGAQTAMMVSSDVPSPAATLLVRVLLWPGILGKAVLVVAMWYFWFNFDQSHWIKKALWFVILFLGFVVGPALYYFFSYRRNEALKDQA
jgi:hypothetical protein